MEDSLLFYGNIAVKLAVGLLAFIAVLRTTNRRQLAQMTPVDLIGNFVMGGIIGGVIYNPDITITTFIIVLATWQLLVVAVTMLRMHTESGQKMIVGSPTPVVRKGVFLQDNFQRVGLDVGDFATLARMHGVHSLHAIWNAQIEPNGQASIQQKDERRTSNILVKNGSVDADSLELLEKDEEWLKNELRKNGYDSYEPIFFAEWNEEIDDKGNRSGALAVVERTPKQAGRHAARPEGPAPDAAPAHGSTRLAQRAVDADVDAAARTREHPPAGRRRPS